MYLPQGEKPMKKLLVVLLVTVVLALTIVSLVAADGDPVGGVRMISIFIWQWTMTRIIWASTGTLGMIRI